PWTETETPDDPVAQEVVPVTIEALIEKPVPQMVETEEAAPWTDTYLRGAPAGGGGLGMGSRKITLDAQGADIKTVLHSISEFAGINIVCGPDVEGEVIVHIKDSPWEEALDILLKAHGYGYREEYGMIRIAQSSRLNKEELEAQTAERKKEELLPLITRIIFVNNSNAGEIRDALANVVSKRGKVDVDDGSNAIIVIDIERNVEKIQKMIVELDQKTYQVDINAKLVEIDVDATREFGINWGLLNLHKSGFGGTGSASVDAGIASSAGRLTFGTVRSWGELNAILEMLERSNRANIISNPRITTMDNREASILVGKEIPLIVADEAGNPITELTKVGIMLKVTPHVNSDQTITLDLHPEVSELQSESTAQGGVIITTSEADTRVVVGNGETAVIGGLIKKVETDLKFGIPILKDIPYLGAIFSSHTKVEKKQELVIFVTPTIVE
ncbi:MAG: type IV pilus secretin PilQ, partial [Candidatus Krumholzibacteria bacterium]|nr:type IV pilus secretin PilQ [Candidatus Krumholzibacteria bacterium]